LLAWLDARIAELGGPVDAAYRARGHRLARVETLLTLTRVRLSLALASENADRDCPFWMESSPSFAGRQIADDRFQLELSSGGKGIVTVQGGQSDVTGGGAGRVTIKRNLGSRWSIGLGAEIGAGADFTKDAMGQRNNLVFGFDVVVPLSLRYRSVNTWYELEVGPLGHFTEVETSLVPGIHLGVSFGAQYLRRRWLLPGAAFTLTWERTFPGDDLDGNQRDAAQFIKIGGRVTVDLDL
jgi:hypothetical protein